MRVHAGERGTVNRLMMSDFTLRETLTLNGQEAEWTERIAAALAAAGGELLAVERDHISFKGDRRAGSWRLLGGIGHASIHRTESGLDLVAAFPKVYPLSAGIVILAAIGLLLYPAAWSMAVLMTTLTPLFVVLVLKRQMKSIVRVLRRAAGA